MARLSKVGRDQLNLIKEMAEQWKNPPPPFNPLFNAERETRRKHMEATIRDNLNHLHGELKHCPNDEYYDRMEDRERLVRSRYDNEYNQIS